jgi:hypothetical protein
MIGYGHEVWSFGGYYFWVSVLKPFSKPKLTLFPDPYGRTFHGLHLWRLAL